MSTSESLIADAKNSIVNADSSIADAVADSSIADAVAESSIVVAENRIVVAENRIVVAYAESEQEKLESMFATKLELDFDQRKTRCASSYSCFE